MTEEAGASELAGRPFDLVVRERMRFGRGAVAMLPELVRDAGGRRLSPPRALAVA